MAGDTPPYLGMVSNAGNAALYQEIRVIRTALSTGANRRLVVKLLQQALRQLSREHAEVYDPVVCDHIGALLDPDLQAYGMEPLTADELRRV